MREDWGLGFSSTSEPAFLALNPNGQVPVVESQDGVLWESNTICRHLASQNGQQVLLPLSPWPRALVERWMDWQATDLNSAWRGVFLGLVRKDAAYAQPAVIAASTGDWNGDLRRACLSSRMKNSPSPTSSSAFSINRWLRTPIERPTLPAFAASFARLGERPAFRHGNYGTLA